MNTYTQKHRFVALINYLKLLPLSGFTYNEFVRQYNTEANTGVICCPAGWLPSIFPENWEWYFSAECNGTLPRFVEKWRHDTKECDTVKLRKELMIFFGIDVIGVEALFFGSVYQQRRLQMPETPAAPRTTLEQVTILIEDYYNRYIQ